MRGATAISTPWLFVDPDAADPYATGQIPLPLPGLPPVLPVAVERPGPDAGDHPLRERPSRFMQAVVEVLAGARPLHQLRPWLTPAVHDELRRRMAHGPRRLASGTTTTARPGAVGARVVSVHVAMVGDEAAEVAARFVHRGRSRAIAARLELQRSPRGELAWRCRDLVWG